MLATCSEPTDLSAFSKPASKYSMLQDGIWVNCAFPHLPSAETPPGSGMLYLESLFLNY